MFRKFFALALLGISYIKILFSGLIKKQNGLKTFLAHYSADGIFPLTAGESTTLSGLSKCISCRWCDSACPRLTDESLFPGPFSLVQGLSRSLADFRHLDHSLDDCKDCNLCNAICPTQVPLKKMIVFVRSHAA